MIGAADVDVPLWPWGVLVIALGVLVRGGGAELVREAWPGPEASLRLILRVAGFESNGK